MTKWKSKSHTWDYHHYYWCNNKECKIFKKSIPRDEVHQAVRELYPNKKIVAVFQPHLFSRTQDFVNEFAKSLSQFDEILLLDIYPARELPIKGVNSSWLLQKINNKNKQLITKKEIVAKIKESQAQVVLTIGAGDIGAEVKHIKKELSIAS